MFKITKKLIVPVIFIFLSSFTKKQNLFQVISPSKKYTANISVEKCEDDLCNGKGEITILSKNSKKIFQKLSSTDLSFFLDKNNLPSVNIIQLYNEQSPLIFIDFNFDGEEDLAIRNGNYSGYGGPSYDVYLFDKRKKQFILNKDLTELAYTNLGMFQTDSKRKRIITFSKSGCCWHQTIEYQIKNNKPIMTYRLTEDQTGENSDKPKITEEKF